MSTEPDLHAIGIDESVAETRERLVGRNVPVIDDPAGASWGVYTDPSGAKVAFGRAEDGTEYTDANLESPHTYPAQGTVSRITWRTLTFWRAETVKAASSRMWITPRPLL